jgi:hypothetical protein
MVFFLSCKYRPGRGGYCDQYPASGNTKIGRFGHLNEKGAIMLPRQSPPVIRPFIFQTPLQLISTPELTDPTVLKKTMELVTGGDPDPNDPYRFLYPISCYQECSILSGFAFAQCLLRCR